MYRFLRTNSDLYDSRIGKAKEVPFNFAKFLVDQDGMVRGYFPPNVRPKDLVPVLETILNE